MIPLMMQENYKPQGWRKSQGRQALLVFVHQRRHAAD